MTDLERLGRYYGGVRALEDLCSHRGVYYCWDKLYGYYEVCANCLAPLNDRAKELRAMFGPFIGSFRGEGL